MMPWTPDEYPVSLKNFPPHVRLKAIEIANALLEEGYAEGSAIPIATAQAKKWAEGQEKRDPRDNYHVVPHPQGWAVRRANASRASSVFATEEEARNRAIDLARNEGLDVILHNPDGTFADHIDLLDEVQPIVKNTD
jgi:uncharacterized protein YdaT